MSATIAILLAATIPLRNPFWPVDYKGVPETIYDEPKVVAKPQVEQAVVEEEKTPEVNEALTAAAAAAKNDQPEDDALLENKMWIAARKSLKIGGTLKNGKRQALTINGHIYADGDLVSTNYESYRFTWRVKGLTQGGTLKLIRVKIREIEAEPEPTSEETKGN